MPVASGPFFPEHRADPWTPGMTADVSDPLNAAACFWHGYRGPAGCYDEMADADGRVRPHWTGFIHQLEQIGLAEVSRRWEEARRLIRENGVTYNVYGDPHGLDRPWQL